MLSIQNTSYTHQDKSLLFKNITLAVHQHSKVALIGNNGSGKSTLLKMIAGELDVDQGKIDIRSTPYYLPQIFGQYNQLSVAQALKVNDKLNALNKILLGELTEENYTTLNEDWTIEERCRQALESWQLQDVDLMQKLETLSGGQKTRVLLAGITLHQPELILLDEPSNHLDGQGRKLLYDFLANSTSTIVVVSHDRKLLNLLDTVFELSKDGIRAYGGNYDFYLEQKQKALHSLYQDVQSKEKALLKAREKERENIERQQKLDSRAKRKGQKAGIARIMMNTLQNNAQKSSSRIKDVHQEKTEEMTTQLQALRSSLPDLDKIKFEFNHSLIHKGKVIFKAQGINHRYGHHFLWQKDLSVQINSGERIVLEGLNGSGKTTLIHIIMNIINPCIGTVRADKLKILYLDQDYSLIADGISVYQQAQRFNTTSLAEHEIKIRLSRFLFFKDDWDKPCSTLSGGEKMRLALCMLIIDNKSPDMIILDEPTNNLDIENIKILSAAIKQYQGTLLVVSHDRSFLKELDIEKFIHLPAAKESFAQVHLH